MMCKVLWGNHFPIEMDAWIDSDAWGRRCERYGFKENDTVTISHDLGTLNILGRDDGILELHPSSGPAIRLAGRVEMVAHGAFALRLTQDGELARELQTSRDT